MTKISTQKAFRLAPEVAKMLKDMAAADYSSEVAVIARLIRDGHAVAKKAGTIKPKVVVRHSVPNKLVVDGETIYLSWAGISRLGYVLPQSKIFRDMNGKAPTITYSDAQIDAWRGDNPAGQPEVYGDHTYDFGKPPIPNPERP